MQKFPKLLIGIMTLVLVLSMQMGALAAVDTPAQADTTANEVTSTPDVLSQEDATGATDETNTAAPEIEPITDIANDDNPNTGLDDTMLNVSGILLVIAVAGIVITTRKGRHSNG